MQLETTRRAETRAFEKLHRAPWALKQPGTRLSGLGRSVSDCGVAKGRAREAVSARISEQTGSELPSPLSHTQKATSLATKSHNDTHNTAGPNTSLSELAPSLFRWLLRLLSLAPITRRVQSSMSPPVSTAPLLPPSSDVSIKLAYGLWDKDGLDPKEKIGWPAQVPLREGGSVPNTQLVLVTRGQKKAYKRGKEFVDEAKLIIGYATNETGVITIEKIVVNANEIRSFKVSRSLFDAFKRAL